jgi:predicted DNA-binding transcriptional regulator AlpA
VELGKTIPAQAEPGKRSGTSSTPAADAEAKRLADFIIKRMAQGDGAHQAADGMEGDGYVFVPQLLKFLGGISRPTMYRWIDDGLLPAPVQIGPNRIAFLRQEVREALAKRPRVPARKASGADDQAA